MRYKAGQWLFIQVPEVSNTQWHPFTITSCPFDPYVSVHVRQVGDFTRALGDALGCGPAQARDLEGVIGQGVKATVDDELALIGKESLFTGSDAPSPQIMDVVNKLKADGLWNSAPEEAEEPQCCHNARFIHQSLMFVVAHP